MAAAQKPKYAPPGWKPGDDPAARTYRRGPEDEWQAGETETDPILSRPPRRPERKAEPKRVEYARDTEPTPERLAKGDVTEWDSRGSGTRMKRARVSAKNPLAELLSRNLISDGSYRAGQAFASAYHRATKEQGAINLESLGGGLSDGLGYSRAKTFGELSAMVRALGEIEHDRLNRARVLIGVCAAGMSIREYAGESSRARQAASNMLVTALARLERAKELEQAT